ncbi:MAG: hypothetical protein ACRECS_27070, partial [Sphingomonas sp.]
RAIGYEEEAVRVYHPVASEAPVIVRYKREVRPDITAALQWMRARRPGLWACPAPPSAKEANVAEDIRKAMERVERIAEPRLREASRLHAQE